jgi:hypothetical protein
MSKHRILQLRFEFVILSWHVHAPRSTLRMCGLDSQAPLTKDFHDVTKVGNTHSSTMKIAQNLHHINYFFYINEDCYVLINFNWSHLHICKNNNKY